MCASVICSRKLNSRVSEPPRPFPKYAFTKVLHLNNTGFLFSPFYVRLFLKQKAKPVIVLGRKRNSNVLIEPVSSTLRAVRSQASIVLKRR